MVHPSGERHPALPVGFYVGMNALTRVVLLFHVSPWRRLTISYLVSSGVNLPKFRVLSVLNG